MSFIAVSDQQVAQDARDPLAREDLARGLVHAVSVGSAQRAVERNQEVVARIVNIVVEKDLDRNISRVVQVVIDPSKK